METNISSTRQFGLFPSPLSPKLIADPSVLRQVTERVKNALDYEHQIILE